MDNDPRLAIVAAGFGCLMGCYCGAWTLYEPIWQGDVLHNVNDCRRYSRSNATRVSPAAPKATGRR